MSMHSFQNISEKSKQKYAAMPLLDALKAINEDMSLTINDSHTLMYWLFCQALEKDNPGITEKFDAMDRW